MLLIYTHKTTARLSYIFKFMLEELQSVQISFTNDKDEYLSWKAAKMSYADTPQYEGDCFFNASPLLFEENISLVKPIVKQDAEQVSLFPVAHNDSVLSHDPFAGAFYMVSRYEEYLPFISDLFERFEAESSILNKTGLIEIPLVNIWAEQVVAALKNKFPQLTTSQSAFRATVTIDIDQAYAFLHKGTIRLTARWIRDLVKGNGEESRLLVKVLRGQAPDPFDSYQYLREQASANAIPFIFFINLGKHSKFDKNIPTDSDAFRRLIDFLQEFGEIGMHPSYYVNKNKLLFTKEIDQLSTLMRKPVIKSRQHYLRLYFPDTYRLLIQHAIKEDYSMGYATTPGFRAGTCSPFYWFDLQKNQVSSLRIFPTTWMEGSFGEDLKMSPDQAWIKMKQLIDTVKKYNGHFIPIWHNHSVTDYGFWKGWKTIFEKMLKEISV